MTTDPARSNWPTVKCALPSCENRLRMRTIGQDDEGNGGRPDVEGRLGRDDQWCSEEHRAISERADDGKFLSVVPNLPGDPAADDGLYSSEQVCAHAGITYRQLDFWCRTGYLDCAIPAAGSGSARRFTADEVRVAVAIRRLIKIGFQPRAAARIARSGLDDGERLRTVPAAPGVLVVLDQQLWDAPGLPPTDRTTPHA